MLLAQGAPWATEEEVVMTTMEFRFPCKTLFVVKVAYSPQNGREVT